MLILFDQGVPIGIKRALGRYTVRTAREQGWSTLLNGELLRAAENAGFQVMLTTDKNMVFQQNLIGYTLAIVALSRNRWSLIEPVLASVAEAVDNATPGTYTVLEIPATPSR